jgi:hypothetical protein
MLRERGSFHTEIEEDETDAAQPESPPQDRVLTPDEIVDLSVRDSFPASDPPSFGGAKLGGPAHALKRSRPQ